MLQEPLVAIEEMTGAKVQAEGWTEFFVKDMKRALCKETQIFEETVPLCRTWDRTMIEVLQVKGQHFTSGARMPEGRACSSKVVLTLTVPSPNRQNWTQFVRREEALRWDYWPLCLHHLICIAGKMASALCNILYVERDRFWWYPDLAFHIRSDSGFCC